ncbi:hypothetical protein [Streptomyces nanshensis]|uniref:hypothetical protein n=1 Tax=Streptomyces nanshensis TaxID=518642 RepID=UPI00085C2AA2|nr:hypothetical protein [Streptomyces nanshensis]
MRKLQKAAVVATMVGSVGILGAGAAAACGHHEPEPVSFTCAQSNGGDSTTDVDGTINVGDALIGGSGDAASNTTQQVCGIGNSNNTNTGGDAESGAGGAGTVGLAL